MWLAPLRSNEGTDLTRQSLGEKAKIGIVNRGEAAVRFIRAVKEFNLLNGTNFETVAFFIDKESEALFVKEADHVYPLSSFEGFEDLSSSPYINSSFFLHALQSTGCQGVWVGWGFLAEDSSFASLLEQNGLVLMGPTAEAMELLGDKIKAKELANRSDVPTLPWSGKAIESLEEAESIAASIGYPVILKSANGGGGRGIRKVFDQSQLAAQFKSVSEEIFRFFGNRVIFMEALVVHGRHLEVQALADYHGNVSTFGVRDCSVQRNNQKIIEETPPADMDPQMSKSLEEASKRLLKAAQYHGAGTVEFLYDTVREQGYFMEVNTRLQVEHPITEQLYDIDLVGMQIAVALGQAIPNNDQEANGHVVEVRLNAEDPDKKFAPTPGQIKRFIPPHLPGIRVDSGFEWGSTIPGDFDSMIAKIIASGPNRRSALTRLQRALNELQIEIDGGTTNQGFLLELLSSKPVQSGAVRTDYVEGFLESIEARRKIKTKWDIALIAAAIYQYERHYHEAFDNFKEKVRRYSSPRQLPSLDVTVDLEHDGNPYSLNVRDVGDHIYHIEVNQQVIAAEYKAMSRDIILRIKDQKYRLQIVPRTNTIQCEVEGVPYVVSLNAGGKIAAPSPSVVLTIEAEENQTVKKGDLLLTLEAMKMEMTVSAPEDGTVKSILVRPGEQIAAGQNLIDLEPTKDETTDKTSDSEPRQLVDFSGLALEPASNQIKHQWNVLERDFYSFFTGYDLIDNPSQCIHAIEQFIEKHPSYKEQFGQLLLKSLDAFIKMKRLFQSTGRDKSGMRDTDASECLMHYLLRKDDREKGLPELFLKNLEDAIKLYSWADVKRYEDTTRALFHLYKAQSSTKDSVELIRLSLLYAQQVFDSAAEFTSPEAFSDLINELIIVGRGNTILIDAAIYTRFELIDRAFQQKIQLERQRQVADLLDTVLLAGADKPDLVRDVIESGHQIVSYLVSRFRDNSDKAEMLLEFVAKRFNRDRDFVSGQFIEAEGHAVYHIKTKKRRQTFDCLVTILSEHEFMQPLTWLDTLINSLSSESLECMILINGPIEHSDLTLTGRMLQQPLQVNLCSLGIYRDDDYAYRSFKPEGDSWIEDKSRRFMSPLRYRELRIERLENFNLDLVYHSRYVHVMKLEAKDNPRDERLFGFVEVPETKFDLNESHVIERINSFEYAILEAVKVLREQQARNKKTYHWNRIIVHIGHTHPLKMDQLGEYPRKITSLIRDIGLEKIVIYTKIEGRKNKEIEAEVLVEKFSTNFNVRGRLPSRKQLQPLDPYTSKVVKSLRMDSPYPYEVIAMLTSRVGEDLPSGKFEEFDIKFDSNGNQVIVSVKGRMPGQNLSNVVFGVIENKDISGLVFKRVMILGDPSKDLGSLAERECRRVIAALDLAEREKLPIEWIPVSSGAAIDLSTGTENLDWTARVLKRIIEFTQKGGEINIIVAGINVGAQSYWNAEATMLMHTKGVLIMTETGSMVLTGKKALDFSGSVSAEDNIGIGGVEQIMAPNGQAQYKVHDIADAYRLLFTHYRISYSAGHSPYGTPRDSGDAIDRNVCEFPYEDRLNQGFKFVGDIIGEKNKERKKPFDMRQIMQAVRDQDSPLLERWHLMKDAETAIVWETQVCGFPVGLLGFESQSLKRYGDIPNDGPDNWTGGTLYPQSSKKIAKAINAFSGQMPVVVLANLSGFDGSPESLRKLQLEYGAEIGRAVVNFKGPLIFIVISRYHGGAYVVFSKSLNPNIRAAALKSTFASVIGGAPAAAVVFPRQVLKNTFSDPQIIEAQERLKSGEITKVEYDDVFQNVHLEQQSKMASTFEGIHTVERAQKVGSIDDIIDASELRPYIHRQLSEGIKGYLNEKSH